MQLRFLFLGMCVLASASQSATKVASPPHLEMDLTGRDYLRIFEKQEEAGVFVSSGDFQDVLDMGKRLYQWVDKINAARPAGQKLSLTTEATQHGYPIEAPRLSNPTIIANNFAALRTKLPTWVTKVVLDGADGSATLPVSDTDFAAAGREVKDVYEAASRWILQQPYLSSYAARKSEDIRGYYFLSKETDLDAKLANWANLDAGKKQQLTEWLVGNCVVSGTSEATCKRQLASSNGTNFYAKYLKAAQGKWNEFFAITQYRNDVEWTSANPNVMTATFRPPSNDVIKDFLAVNIEDEWKFGNWQLKLDFRPNAASRIEFEAGATPHVNDLAGDVITMDENAPLTEYDVQWTIRHEYGHVIGFPDCYLEFYDRASATMISYQLDITNLMCSRRGHLQQKHVDELKRVYYKG